MSASFTRLIEAGTGVRADQSRLRITAAAATADQARSLRINPGDPVLINEFVVRAAGRPFEAARAVFRADRYAFTVEVFSSGDNDAETLSNSYRASSGALGIVSQEVSS
jgi:DNA-binding GntR family transcriptional regulator